MEVKLWFAWLTLYTKPGRKFGKLLSWATLKGPVGSVVSSFQTHQFIHICTTTLSCKTCQRANQISHISSLTSFYALKAHKEKSTSLSNDSHLSRCIDGMQPREECHIPYWFDANPWAVVPLFTATSKRLSFYRIWPPQCLSFSLCGEVVSSEVFPTVYTLNSEQGSFSYWVRQNYQWTNNCPYG